MNERNFWGSSDSSAFQPCFCPKCYLYFQNHMQTMICVCHFFTRTISIPFHAKLSLIPLVYHQCWEIKSMIHFTALWHTHTHTHTRANQYICLPLCRNLLFNVVYLRCKMIVARFKSGMIVWVVHVFGSLSIAQLLQQPRNFILYQATNVTHRHCLYTVSIFIFVFVVFFFFIFRSCFYFSRGFLLLDWA